MTTNERILQLSGSPEQIEKCQAEIGELMKEAVIRKDQQSQNEQNKKSLLEEDKLEDYSTYQSNADVKDEDCTQQDDNGNQYGYGGFQSQKDFLFDPYAAAYYERFSKFQPGTPINFNEFQWPAF